MKKLPIGTQSFENLRSNDCLYVDKTAVIQRMIASGRVYFLSRPRRFGKSLLISTMKSLFEGRKALFEGLSIHDTWDWSQNCPVITIDWTLINHSTPEKMEKSLISYLKEIARDYQITLASESAPDCFRALIKSLHDRSGQKTVVLIDEYDKPVTAHLFDPLLDRIRTAVHDFYQVLKGSDMYLRFIFLTGVSKFSGHSIFSALNHPDDITLQKPYASICGYTQEELESNFSEYIDSAADCLKMTKAHLLERIRYWYNGYTWDGQTAIYNPFSTLQFFSFRRFNNYWFRTGTPTFLIDMLQRRNRIDAVLEPFEVNESVFDGYNPQDIGEVPLLFQTGYLTVRQMELIDGRARYTLGVPNSEVREAFMTCLLNAYSKYPVESIQPMIDRIKRQISDGDASALEQNLRLLLAYIPYRLHIKKESYYHSLFLLLMKMLEFDIRGEILTNLGRIDAIWRQPGLTVVAEIKYHAGKKTDTLLNEALEQIRDRRYYEACLDGRVMLMAIAFTGREIKCKMENIR
ncbi:MAG: ATP-binding protein [Tannerella sp.]|jgi:hypothetical protein|nr:ATP-binding protein [Tannerella sp.]